ncbi:M20 family metallo-hydrolase [Corynebacterium ammoniagenes]|uniref:Amidase, hydantoinase/carbamoylase family n=1 Tax=Corynebacterium ammoniagenes DSM 20306 TaxID=649754 RepID=A0ABP2IGF2_CORAM|nr:M20 family metallo-hydrolase [Corynebacterium ammoniagenes]APT82060.1 peptidase M20 [Corynebacterium ammoniagenes DSM 20306]AQS73169.1 Zn-dependent hydrolase [Corynebacterium ammoniagenes]EFG80396.1 amidase, hydantoinase/carbamoylase family [Corynebacterium ammoniagenes DSM 20306]
MSTDWNQRFLAHFDAMSENGATEGGGVERQAASEGDIANRKWFEALLQELGAKVSYDEIGNQYGVFEFDPELPFVGLGSHLDSQPLAGRYDGAYGVLAGAHAAARVVERIKQTGETPTRNIAVINWFNEEGSRFAPSMMGSSVFTEKLSLETALNTTDLSGTTVSEAIGRANWQPVQASPVISEYAEIHVEQGKELEHAGNQIGLVTATWGARKFQLTVKGEQGHTGSTLMSDRKDALFGASLVIASVRRFTDQFEPGQLQASVSQLTLEPNSPVTIAREVIFNVDLRSPESSVLRSAQDELQSIIESAESESKTEIQCDQTHHWDLNPYPRDGVELSREVVEKLGISYQEIFTVAGHDSTNMKDFVPTVMLFVPSKDGISHNEAEYTKPEDCLAGVEVFTEVAGRLIFS